MRGAILRKCDYTRYKRYLLLFVSLFLAWVFFLGGGGDCLFVCLFCFVLFFRYQSHPPCALMIAPDSGSSLLLSTALGCPIHLVSFRGMFRSFIDPIVSIINNTAATTAAAAADDDNDDNDNNDDEYHVYHDYHDHDDDIHDDIDYNNIIDMTMMVKMLTMMMIMLRR